MAKKIGMFVYVFIAIALFAVGLMSAPMLYTVTDDMNESTTPGTMQHAQASVAESVLQYVPWVCYILGILTILFGILTQLGG